MATLLVTGGKVPPMDVTPVGGAFTLDALYTVLRCQTIEVVRLAPDRIMVVDEDGKGRGRPLNEMATLVARVLGRIRPADEIVGMVLICSPAEMGEETA